MRLLKRNSVFQVNSRWKCLSILGKSKFRRGILHLNSLGKGFSSMLLSTEQYYRPEEEWRGDVSAYYQPLRHSDEQGLTQDTSQKGLTCETSTQVFLISSKTGLSLLSRWITSLRSVSPLNLTKNCFGMFGFSQVKFWTTSISDRSISSDWPNHVFL